MPPARSRRTRTLIAVAVLLFVTTIIYVPGLCGPFEFDDDINITSNSSIAIKTLDYDSLRGVLFPTETRMLGRPLPMLTFALNHYQAGGFNNSFWFKATNLLIHLFNVLLIFWLSRLLLRVFEKPSKKNATYDTVWIPWFVAAIWAVHPLNVSTVLYVVQRMTSLATFFMLAGTIFFIHGRETLQNNPRRGITLMTAGVIGGLGFGGLCKEVALLLPLYLLVIEFVFFDNAKKARPALAIRFHAISVGVLALATAYYLTVQWRQVFGIYDLREFTPWQRLLTEPRVLWLYLSLIFFPVPSRFTLFHDDIATSTSLLTPWTTLPATLGLIIPIVAAFILRRRAPMFAFAVLWFVAGHSLESGIIGLELAHEHRNYLPMFGPLFAVVYTIAKLRPISKPLRIALPAFLVATFAWSTAVLANYWSDHRTLTLYMVKHHPNSARSQAMLAELIVRDTRDPLRAIHRYKRAADLAPYEISYLLRATYLAAMADVALPKGQSPVLPSLPNYLVIRTEGNDAYLTLSNDLLHKIDDLLSSQPIHARVFDALKELAQCVEFTPQRCVRLRETIIRWHEIAVASTHSNDSIRKNLYQSLAALYVDAGSYPAALQAAQRARALDSTSLTFILMEANIHYLMGDIAEAKRVFSPLENNDTLDMITREQRDKLSALLKSR